MGLSFLVDEHVDRAYVRALRSNGYTVETVDAYEAGIADSVLLGRCHERGHVLLTNDRDFVRLHDQHRHAGILVYTDQSRPVGDLVGSIRRIALHFSPEEMRIDSSGSTSGCTTGEARPGTHNGEARPGTHNGEARPRTHNGEARPRTIRPTRQPGQHRPVNVHRRIQLPRLLRGLT